VSLTSRVLVALIAGITIGLLLSTSQSPYAVTAVSIVEPVGTLFINAIRMTVIPLVFSLLIVGIASSADPRVIARLGGRAVALFLVLLTASGITGALVAPPVLARIPLDQRAVDALRASTASASGQVVERARAGGPTLAQWLTDLVPANPVRAAADGAMLPLIIFAVAFGLALLTMEAARRDAVVGFFRGVADAMLVIVRWVLQLAPIGVFALSLPLVARLGFAAVSALASYVVIVSLASALFVLLVIYPMAAVFGRITLAQFARAVLPGQAVAFTARSSLAALPALIEGARTRLGLREEVASFLLPLASATFRTGATLGLTVGALFIAKLYGMTLTITEIATVVLTAIITSFSIPGVPAGSIIAMAPVLQSVGLPLEGLGILLGVDTIPDSFRTTANVTGQMAVAAIAGREEEPRSVHDPAAALAGVPGGELPVPRAAEAPATE
jgi:proton glutamate symport protein